MLPFVTVIHRRITKKRGTDCFPPNDWKEGSEHFFLFLWYGKSGKFCTFAVTCLRPQIILPECVIRNAEIKPIEYTTSRSIGIGCEFWSSHLSRFLSYFFLATDTFRIRGFLSLCVTAEVALRLHLCVSLKEHSIKSYYILHKSDFKRRTRTIWRKRNEYSNATSATFKFIPWIISQGHTEDCCLANTMRRIAKIHVQSTNLSQALYHHRNWLHLPFPLSPGLLEW